MSRAVMKRLSIIMVVILFILLIQSPWFKNLLTIEEEDLKLLRENMGYQLLLLTIPLGILQGVVTIFPFATIVVLHIWGFGLVQGLFYSWLAALLGSLVCFLLARHFLQDWSQKILEKNKEKYKRAVGYIERYGFWGLIVLRTFPFMPSNLISIIGSLSPIPFKLYFWSSFIGNIPMVIIQAALSSPITTSVTAGYGGE